MSLVVSPEYEYVRKLVFFGFICGITFSLVIALFVNIGKK